MNCIHCDEPNPHPGTRKCTDIQACDGRQEYARGVADERARVVAWLRERLIVGAAAIERGEHEREGAGFTHRRPDGRECDYLASGSICTKCGARFPEAT